MMTKIQIAPVIEVTRREEDESHYWDGHVGPPMLRFGGSQFPMSEEYQYAVDSVMERWNQMAIEQEEGQFVDAKMQTIVARGRRMPLVQSQTATRSASKTTLSEGSYDSIRNRLATEFQQLLQKQSRQIEALAETGRRMNESRNKMSQARSRLKSGPNGITQTFPRSSADEE